MGLLPELSGDTSEELTVRLRDVMISKLCSCLEEEKTSQLVVLSMMSCVVYHVSFSLF